MALWRRKRSFSERSAEGRRYEDLAVCAELGRTRLACADRDRSLREFSQQNTSLVQRAEAAESAFVKARQGAEATAAELVEARQRAEATAAELVEARQRADAAATDLMQARQRADAVAAELKRANAESVDLAAALAPSNAERSRPLPMSGPCTPSWRICQRPITAF